MSADPDQTYFSDGIAEDIITELSRSRSLLVIARNSSFTYQGRSVDIRQIARELGVRYVHEGSVRRSGDLVRVTAQLIDAETGSHLWAERYDRTLADIFDVQDEITSSIVCAIQPEIALAEQQRAMRKPPHGLGAWDAYQRGLWHRSRIDSTENQTAREYVHRAIEADFDLRAALPCPSPDLLRRCTAVFHADVCRGGRSGRTVGQQGAHTRPERCRRVFRHGSRCRGARRPRNRTRHGRTGYFAQSQLRHCISHQGRLRDQLSGGLARRDVKRT